MDQKGVAIVAGKLRNNSSRRMFARLCFPRLGFPAFPADMESDAES